MKWFKHFTDCLQNPFINALIDECGFDGYGRFWRLVEMVVHQCKEKEDDSAIFTASMLRRNLTMTQRKLDQYLATIERLSSLYSTMAESSPNFHSSRLDERYTITIANLPKLRDDYTRKKKKVSGHTPDKVLLEEEVEGEAEEEVEGEKKKESNNGALPGIPSAPDPKKQIKIDSIKLIDEYNRFYSKRITFEAHESGCKTLLKRRGLTISLNAIYGMSLDEWRAREKVFDFDHLYAAQKGKSRVEKFAHLFQDWCRDHKKDPNTYKPTPEELASKSYDHRSKPVDPVKAQEDLERKRKIMREDPIYAKIYNPNGVKSE